MDTSIWKYARVFMGYHKLASFSNKLLKKRLIKFGYYEVFHTPGLWKHVICLIQFTLVVDDFGIKFVGKEHTDHLLSALKKYYTHDIGWTGSLYCGITLEWGYKNRTLEISMLGYIKQQLQKYAHLAPNKLQ